ncbi:MAG: branched-chain amino acid aminotransferase [Chitinophagaceae bacterium]|nr:branched-chain amino acid aminotransferase [Chitinophagaceae bacterium]
MAQKAMRDIEITRATTTKLNDFSIEQFTFGKHYTDHMLEADYIDGEWTNVSIKPYQPISISPACSAIHYGQSIFEGIKAYRDKQSGKIRIFRPYDNYKRFNISAHRMQMPEVPEDLFIEGMRQLIALDEAWVPSVHDYSLYIRPFMFATDGYIGVKPSTTYKFLIILSPTGPYYSHPMRIFVEEKYVRAVEGGVGFAKNAGNYGAAMFPTAEAKKRGYDQVLWTDAKEHKYVQECGTMNVFFVFGNTAVTPGLESGTILEGVTRMSTIQLMKDMGVKVEERDLSIGEIKERHKAGELTEAFGTGTAATVLMIRELADNDDTLLFPEDKWKVGPAVKAKLDAIREGSAADTYNWMVEV